MQDKFEMIEDLLTDDGEMTAMEFVLTIVVAFLVGVVFGMVFSPKGDTVIGSNNGNDNVGSFGPDDIEWIDDDEDEE